MTSTDPEEYGDLYTLTALKCDSRLFLSHIEGDRSLITAQTLVKQIKKCQSSDERNPLFASDSWDPFEAAIREVYGLRSKYFAGKLKNWTKVPPAFPPDLHYVQIKKIREKGRVIQVTSRVVLGETEEVQIRLQKEGTGTVQTSYVERLHLTIRTCLARFIRKSLNFSKCREIHTAVIDFFQAWYNFIKPHHSLRQYQPSGTKKWILCTPAMAEGLTNHIWTLEELATFRVPIH